MANSLGPIEAANPAHIRSRIAGQTWAALAGIVALGGLVRFVALDLQSFDHDESVTAGRVLRPGLTDTLETLPSSERTPPVYYTLAWVWSRLFGTGEVGLRSFSALAGTLTVVVMFLAVRRFVSERAGLMAALLTAVNPLFVGNAGSARAYALGILFTAATLWATARLDDRPETGRAVFWAVCASLAVGTHYFTMFVVLPAAAWMLVRRPRSRPIWAAAAGPVVTLAALAPLAWEQAVSKGGDADFGEGGLPRQVAVTVARFTVGENPVIPSPFPVDALFRTAGVIVAALGVTAIVVALRSEGASRRRGAALGVGLGATGVGLPVAAALVGLDFYSGHNALFALVPLLMAVAAGLTAGNRRVAAMGAIIVALQLAVVVAANLEPGLQRPDWRGLVERLGPLREGDVVTAPRTGDDPLRFYLGAHSMPSDGGQVRRLVIVSFEPYESGMPDIVQDPPVGFTVTRAFGHDSFRVHVLSGGPPRRMRPSYIRDRANGATAALVAEDD